MTIIDIKILNQGIFNCILCNPWSRKCIFGHQNLFLNQLETEIINHIYSGGHFGKNDCHDSQILNLSIYNCLFLQSLAQKCMFRHQHFCFSTWIRN